MGNGIVKDSVVLPDVDTFKKITAEYDRLKQAGISVDEMYMLMHSRVGGSSGGVAISSTAKDQEIRGADKVTVSNKSHDLRLSMAPAGAAALSASLNGILGGLVLLIDDSPVAAKVASKVLQQVNFQVVVAESAERGIEILRNRHREIQLVFLDVVMPKVDGLECLVWIKKDPDISYIPVYMLSGLDDQTLTEACIERGAEGMIMKPLSTHVLEAIISEQSMQISGAPENPAAGNMSSSSAAPTSSSSGGGGQRTDTATGEKDAVANKYLGGAWQSSVVVSVGRQAPAFKLCDSDFNEFTYPVENASNTARSVVIAFIPTCYLALLYESDGFMMRLFEDFVSLESEDRMPEKQVDFLCVSSDLPWALAAAKDRFSLPFTLLSDPTHQVSKRFVGNMDVGKYQATSEEYQASRGGRAGAGDGKEAHPQNSWMGPALGLVYIDRQRQVRNKWVAVGVDGEPNISLQSPSVATWVRTVPTAAAERKRISPPHSRGHSPTHSRGQSPMHSRPSSPPLLSVLTTANGISNTASSMRNGGGHAQPQSFSSSNKSPSPRRGSMSMEGAAGRSPPKRTAGIATAAHNDESANSPKHILIVDDSSVSSRVVSKKIEKLGYGVSCAYNGFIAFDMMKKDPNKYTAVVVDVMMPVCDGMELLQKVKTDASLLKIPIIMLSGLEGSVLAENCMNLGAAGLLKKPLDEDIFQSIMQGLGIATKA